MMLADIENFPARQLDQYFYEIYFNSENPTLDAIVYEQWGPHFDRYRPGNIVQINSYALESYGSRELYPTDIEGIYLTDQSGAIIFSTSLGLFSIVVKGQPSDFSFVERIQQGSSQMARVRSLRDDQEYVLKVFPPSSRANASTDTEYEANQLLAQAGYPVAQHTAVTQYFYPWQDTYSYRYIVGDDIYQHTMNSVVRGRVEDAMQCFYLFGLHLQSVWADLLNGLINLPDGKTFFMADNMMGGFIYTGKNDIRDAFVRIDLLGVGYGESVGLEKRVKQVIEEIQRYFPGYQQEFTEAFLAGIT